MKIKYEHLPLVLEIIVLLVVGILYLPLFVYAVIANIVDYRILKKHHLKKKKWDFNICCGNTNGSGINADIIKRNVPNFVLIKNVHKLSFRNKEFKNIICSHTLEHVENPDKFYKELMRISKNVVILVPPLWDIACLGAFQEHKWQFLTFRTKHVNNLPSKFKLPYWWYQKKFRQEII